MLVFIVPIVIFIISLVIINYVSLGFEAENLILSLLFTFMAVMLMSMINLTVVSEVKQNFDPTGEIPISSIELELYKSDEVDFYIINKTSETGNNDVYRVYCYDLNGQFSEKELKASDCEIIYDKNVVPTIIKKVYEVPLSPLWIHTDVSNTMTEYVILLNNPKQIVNVWE